MAVAAEVSTRNYVTLLWNSASLELDRQQSLVIARVACLEVLVGNTVGVRVPLRARTK